MTEQDKAIEIYPTLYKRDSKGKIREWRLERLNGEYRTVAGLQDGKQVTSEWRYAPPKSQDTDVEQAKFEIDASYRHQLERDYFSNVSEVDTPRIFEPMLAHTYKTWNGPAYSQPKLDGIRCIATAKGLFSRQGKEFVSVPHINQALEAYFERNPDAILDGELYNHELKDNFNEISSLVRKKKPTETDLVKSAELIQFHAYDLYSPAVFRERHDLLTDSIEQLGDPFLRVVPKHTCVWPEDLDRYYAEYLADGYEGQMVRYNKTGYEKKRSKALLKRKEFQDAEFEVVRIEEGQGNWKGHAKRVIYKLEDGREAGAGIKGNKAFTAQLLLENPKYTKIRYFELTPDGVPRFGVATDWFSQERDD